MSNGQVQARRLMAWQRGHPPCAWPVASTVATALHGVNDTACAPKKANKVRAAMLRLVNKWSAQVEPFHTQPLCFAHFVMDPRDRVFFVATPAAAARCSGGPHRTDHTSRTSRTSRPTRISRTSRTSRASRTCSTSHTTRTTRTTQTSYTSHTSHTGPTGHRGCSAAPRRPRTLDPRPCRARRRHRGGRAPAQDGA